jgi:glutamate formiminotransferase / formiminotetrahydrofolate cyclodeaminase
LLLIDADTRAFNAILEAFKLPKYSEEEKQHRLAAIEKATRGAIEVPLQIMQLSYESMEVLKEMAEKGNPNSVSDAGVGALAARSAVLGAAMNVRINAKSLADKEFIAAISGEAAELEQKAIQLEKAILAIVNRKIAENA